MTDTNPFAALLDGVPRHNLTLDGNHYNVKDGKYVRYADVLAALAAVPADLAEAGKVLDVTDGQINEWTFTEMGQWPSFEAQSWACRVAHLVLSKRVPALLARIAAQEAQMKADGERAADLMIQHMRRAEAAEIAIAAERAKVAKLVEAAKNGRGFIRVAFWSDDPIANAVIAEIDTAITEAQQ